MISEKKKSGQSVPDCIFLLKVNKNVTHEEQLTLLQSLTILALVTYKLVGFQWIGALGRLNKYKKVTTTSNADMRLQKP